MSLVCPGGLLNQRTRNALEKVLEAELAEIGPVEIEVPRRALRGGFLGQGRQGHHQVRNTPVYVVMSVITSGEREIFGDLGRRRR